MAHSAHLVHNRSLWLCCAVHKTLHFILGVGHEIFYCMYQSFHILEEVAIHVFYKKLGSGHSTKSFLISHEILSVLVPNMFLDI